MRVNRFKSSLKLGVNIDHVATLRQARLTSYPDPVEAALAAQRAGANAITVHLREDRRHIQDDDLFRLREAISIHMNQELAPVAGMVEIALELRPHEVCLVPERREELTTEGGLDVAGLEGRLAPIIQRFKAHGIGVSLFIDPEPVQIEAAAMLGADFVELHTGTYANLADADIANSAKAGTAAKPAARRIASVNELLSEVTRGELKKLRAAVAMARSLKLKPNVGHGLNYRNVAPVAAIPGLVWLHIGHSIVARSIMVGMVRAVREMNALINRPPPAVPRSAPAKGRSAPAARRR
jgi:pyridoxine 5-phosphate synthase